MEIMLILLLCILLYKYLKGSVAFYILFGVLFVYFFTFILKKIGFFILPNLISQVTQYGLIVIAIIFQPELRNLLVTIGNNRVAKQLRKLKSSIFDNDNTERAKKQTEQIVEAISYFTKNKIGATIVLFEKGDISNITNTGIHINSTISSKLLESIFVKESPLHDGAVIIQNQEIKAASCILPVSEKLDLPARIGLRHKSAVGVTEMTNSLAIIISETTGNLSYAIEGRLFMDKPIATIVNKINTILNS